MKILIIHHSGSLGGGTISCFDVVNAINKNEDEIILSLPPGENAARHKAKELKINILNENIMPLIFGYYNGSTNILRVTIKSVFSLKYRRKWKKILRQLKPDLVLLNSIIQWPMISLLNSMNIKNICFVRETMRGKPNNIINKIIAKSLQKANGVVFLSNFDKKQWSLVGNVSQTVIPDTLNLKDYILGINKENSRKKLKLKGDVFYVLYVGGMSKLKGARTLVKAVNQCQEENIEILFLGDLGTELINLSGIQRRTKSNQIAFINEVYNYVQKNKLHNRIRFIGIQRNMNEWYSACDVVVFPAEKAHQARPIYEAGAFNKPVIVSDFPNFNEYLKSGINGLVFEPGNFIELANAIEVLYKDPSLCANLGKNNFKLTDSLHNCIKINIKIEKFIKEVISK